MEELKRKYIPFHIKITVFILLFFVIMLTLISIAFYHTTEKMRSEAVYRLEYTTREAGKNIDDIILNIYSVSDTFALDDRLLEYTNGDYDGNPVKKRSDTVRVVNSLFASYDFLRRNEKMAAFYTRSGELFNFLDPNADEELCKEKLNELNVNDSKKLAKFSWYDVQDNFLKSDKTGNIRKDMAVIGSRRVFSRAYNTYTGVHIFAINEETLYNQYKEMAEQYKADIYIVDETGRLLSSSSEDALKAGRISDELIDKVVKQKYDKILLNDGRDLVTAGRSDVNGWITIVCTSMRNVTAVVDSLQKWIIWIIIFCAVSAIVAVILFYRRFIAPVSLMNSSMQKAYNGDLNAYIHMDKNNELSEMIDYYNYMLESINKNMEQRINMEQYKKRLEMEVLMNQINPHFLYNTLETMVWKSSEAGIPDVGRIAAALGRMYRLSVSGGNLFVSLKNELEHVMAYIKIQESRYDGRFEFDTAMADRAEISRYYTLKIILQPIVENALNHGMNGIDRILKIRICVNIYDDFIKIRVIDNGIGMSRETLTEVRKKIKNGSDGEIEPNVKSTGIGMHNIYDRLRIYFGIENGLKIYSKYNVGTVVEIKIPKITKDEADEKNSNKNI
ncbi:MAG: histidine kinase [Clostridia bacterium]|nr:histidine kinase [Clostridia bacterium]